MKKLLGIFAGLALLFTICSSVAFANDIDVNEMSMLNKLGIFNGYDDGSLHEDENITRMEYSAVIIRCLGFEELAKSFNGKESFSDVESESWGSGYVYLAKELGLINGYNGNVFAPNENITVTDAAKILVSALGYGVQAEKNGGYPSGYLSVAVSTGMLKGVNGLDSKATRGDVAKMIANSLETEIITTSFSNKYMTFEKSEYILLDCMNISKISDKVTAVYGYSMTDSSIQLEKDELVISDTVYKTTVAPENAYVGMESYIYIKGYGDDATVVLVIPKGKNTAITISAEDIDSSTTLSTLNYWSDRKMKKLNLAKNMSLVYNGESITTTKEFTPQKLCPESGYVTLIDADANNEYETVFVKNYKTYVIQNIKTESQMVYDIFGNNFTYEDVDEIVVYKNDKPINIEDIKAGEVVSAAVSLSGEKMEIIVSDNSISGEVESTYTQDGKTYYTISSDTETDYCCTPEYLKALSNGYSSAQEFSLGDSVIWYMNAFDVIANVQIAEESIEKMSYGYLIEAEQDNGPFDDTIYFKIITVDNVWQDFQTVPDKKTLFGYVKAGQYTVSRVETDEIVNEIGSGENTTAQLVKYKLNEDGYIKELYLLDNKKNSNYFSMDEERSNSAFAYHIISNKHFYDDNTTVIHIPSLGVYPERISAGRPSDYFGNNKSYSVECYDIDDNGYVNLIVYCAAVTSYNNLYIKHANSPVMLVTAVKGIYDEEYGTSYLVIEGYEDGRKVQQLVSESLDSSRVQREIQKGMVIQYETTTELRSYAKTSDEPLAIALYNILFDAREKEQENFSYWNYYTSHVANAKIKIAYGTVTRLDYPFFRTDTSGEPVYEMSGGVDYYKYNSETGFEKIDSNEICEGDKVFVRTRYNLLKEVIVVE